MVARFFAVALLLPALLALLGCDGRRVPITDFDQGFNAGVEAVREARQQKGILGELGMRGVAEFGLIPNDPKKSADWNAGARQGVAAELKR